MHKLLEVPRRNFARARLTISLARTSPTKGVILVLLNNNIVVLQDKLHYKKETEFVDPFAEFLTKYIPQYSCREPLIDPSSLLKRIN